MRLLAQLRIGLPLLSVTVCNLAVCSVAVCSVDDVKGSSPVLFFLRAFCSLPIVLSLCSPRLFPVSFAHYLLLPSHQSFILIFPLSAPTFIIPSPHFTFLSVPPPSEGGGHFALARVARSRKFLVLFSIVY